MANRDLFSIRVRRPAPINRTITATSTDTITNTDGYSIASNIPTVKKKVKRTRRAFNVTLSSTKEHDVTNLKCSYCHDVGELADTIICNGNAGNICAAVYHKECWNEPGRWRGVGCKVMGCRSTSYTQLTKKKKSKKKKTADTNGGLLFVLTGKMSKKRTEITKLITEHGGRVATSVTRKVNYLVCGANSVGTSKWSRAAANSIPDITEDDLYTLLGVGQSLRPEVIVTLDGFSDEDGYECEATYVRSTQTLVVLRDDDGELIRFSRYGGDPTPATLRSIGSWRLSADAIETYCVSQNNDEDVDDLFAEW